MAALRIAKRSAARALLRELTIIMIIAVLANLQPCAHRVLVGEAS
jgi:hypothetical protein